MPKKVKRPSALQIIAAIKRHKGNCSFIANDLHMQYREVLDFKKNPKLQKYFKLFPPVKRGKPQGTMQPNKLQILGIEKIGQVILQCGGIASDVAKKLNVSYMTVLQWKKDPEVAAYFASAVEKTIDLAESKLVSNIKSRKEASVFFYLKCKGHSRGYIETQRNIMMNHDQYEKMRDDEIDNRLRDLERSITAAENRTPQVE